MQLYRGNLDQADQCLQTARSLARTRARVNANLKLGEVYLNQKKFDSAKARFEAAVSDNPQMASLIEELRQEQHVGASSR